MQGVTVFGGAAVLPDDGVMDGFAGGTVPDNGSFALVGDADSGDVFRLQAGFGQCFGQHRDLRAPDFLGIVLNPAWFGEVLGERLLCDADGLAVTVKDDGARRSGTLVKRHDEFVLHTHSSSSEWGAKKSTKRAVFLTRKI